MNRLLLVLPLSFLLIVACDSNQGTQKSTAEKSAVEEVSPEKISAPVEPTAVDVKKDVATEVTAQPALKVSMSGEQVYQKSCQSCHASGAAGAPKLGDSAAWKPRVAKGTDTLYMSALKGIPGTAMMAKGTCGACSEAELQAAVDYMVSKVN